MTIFSFHMKSFLSCFFRYFSVQSCSRIFGLLRAISVLVLDFESFSFVLTSLCLLSFHCLTTIISAKILVNDEMAQVRTGKEGISVEIMMHCLLRWLAGGSYIDIRLSAGISPAYCYTSVYKCMDAILGSEGLSYKFPSTAKEL